MKADFEKFIEEHQDEDTLKVHKALGVEAVFNIDEINQFAENFAKQKAIGFAKYLGKNYSNSEIAIVPENLYQNYIDQKDDESPQNG